LAEDPRAYGHRTSCEERRGRSSVEILRGEPKVAGSGQRSRQTGGASKEDGHRFLQKQKLRERRGKPERECALM